MLKLEDIKVGMRVNPDDLDEIYNILIILTNFDDNDVGEIVYIGQPNTIEADTLYSTLREICTIYHTVNEDLEDD
jgi:hypothetical protein